MSELFVGIDLGGTKTNIGFVTREKPGEILRSARIATIKDRPRKAIKMTVDTIFDLISRLEITGLGRNLRIVAAGIGVPGPVDFKRRTITILPNLPKWHDFPISETLEEELNVPVVLENDANVAALGEKMFGAGKKFTNFIYVTLGTGIGGALILDGRLYRGHTGRAGEIGHIQIDPEGPECGCGHRGCLETLAAGPAIERAYGKPSPEVFDLAARGDRRAQEVLEVSGRALGKGLAQVVTLLDPEAVIIGGGMSQGSPYALSIYLRSCSIEMQKEMFFGSTKEIPLIPGALGDDAPLLGAAWLARKEFEKLLL